jgi:integrase
MSTKTSRLMKFTPRAVAALAAGEKRVDYYDTLTTGFGVCVHKSGEKRWTFRRRVGKQTIRMTLGDATVVPLADARESAKNAIRDIAKGVDPSAAKREAREADTVAEFAERYVRDYAVGPGGEDHPRNRRWKDDAAKLRNVVVKAWGPRAMKSIVRRDVRELLGPRGKIASNRLRSLLHRFFNVAIQWDVVENNPVRGTIRNKEKARERALTEDEIRGFWEKCDGLTPAMGAAFKVRLLTAARGGEVFGMRARDLDFESGWWTVPGEASKNGRPHRVPMCGPVVGLLKPLAEGKNPEDLVFAGSRGKRLRAEACGSFGLPNFRGHDLRHTAASFMASGGVPELTVGKVLNHTPTGITGKVYVHYSYDAEKKAALEWWAAKVDSILRNEENGGKVLAFARA